MSGSYCFNLTFYLRQSARLSPAWRRAPVTPAKSYCFHCQVYPETKKQLESRFNICWINYSLSPSVAVASSAAAAATTTAFLVPVCAVDLAVVFVDRGDGAVVVGGCCNGCDFVLVVVVLVLGVDGIVVIFSPSYLSPPSPPTHTAASLSVLPLNN